MKVLLETHLWLMVTGSKCRIYIHIIKKSIHSSILHQTASLQHSDSNLHKQHHYVNRLQLRKRSYKCTNYALWPFKPQGSSRDERLQTVVSCRCLIKR